MAKPAINQKGAVIVLAAIVIAVIFALLALTFGIGLTLSNQSVALPAMDSAVSAALSEYLREPSSTNPPTSVTRSAQTRAEDALVVANNILIKHRVLVDGSSTAALSDNNNQLKLYNVAATVQQEQNGFFLQFGTWGDNDNSCTDIDSDGTIDVPCFRPILSSFADPAKINAARIVKPKDSIKGPLRYFAKFFGYQQQQDISNTDSTKLVSTAVLIPECTAFLLDVSQFSVMDSHQNSPYHYISASATPGPNYISDPPGSALFAYQQSAVTTPASYDKKHWDNLAQCGAATCSGPNHYKEDYLLVETKRGATAAEKFFWVDKRHDPMPLRSMLDALNGLVTEYAKNVKASDKAFLIAMDRNIIDKVPASGVFDSNKDIRYLLQLSNYKNFKNDAGVISIDPAVPNFVTEGWFPDATRQEGNFPLGLRLSINELHAQCPHSSKRKIYVITPGVIHAGFNESTLKSIPLNTYNDYLNYETSKILDGDILNDLKQYNIEVNFLNAANSFTKPNFCNRGSPPLSVYQLFNSGFKPYSASLSPYDDTECNSTNNTIAESTNLYIRPARPTPNPMSACGLNDPACTWRFLGASNPATSIWGRSNYILSKIAYETNGKICPILNQGPASDYDTPGNPASMSGRPSGSIQTTAVKQMSAANFGAECFNETTDFNRISFAEEYAISRPTPPPIVTPIPFTVTPTNTSTPAGPSTITSTPTITPTGTPTETGTETDTPTITPSPVDTDTPTITPTETDTSTVTPTGTDTDTPTITPTGTDTDTPTITPTETDTSTVTPTETDTDTPTITPTETQTDTPTITPTDTDTSTPAPTDTFTPIPTDTNTSVPTDTHTPAPTDTDTAIPTDTHTPAATDTHTAVPTDTHTSVPTDTHTAVPTDTHTAVPTDTHTSVPTDTHTAIPTDTHTAIPTDTHTAIPTDTHTAIPTDTHTAIPTDTHTAVPTDTETAIPTDTHTAIPTDTHTAVPTDTETAIPTATETFAPQCITCWGNTCSGPTSIECCCPDGRSPFCEQNMGALCPDGPAELLPGCGQCPS